MTLGTRFDAASAWTWCAASIVALSMSAAHAEPPLAASVAPSSDGALEMALLVATNEARAKHDLAPLTWDEGLARVARAHAAENADRNVLDHGSPDPRRDTPAERIGGGGVALVEIGENLAWMPGEDVARRSVEGWLGSPPHRRNLLDPDFTHVGFGTSPGPEGTYVAQLFGVRPWRRVDAGVVLVEQSTTRLYVDVTGPAGVGGALFRDGVAVSTFAFTGEAQTIVIDDPQVPGRFDLAGLVSAGRYQAVHAIDVDEDGGSEVPSAPSGPASVLGARWVREVDAAFVASVTYEEADPSWAVVVDGRHRLDAVVEGGTLSVQVAGPRGPVEVAIGTFTSETSIRILERFTLMPASMQLLPGKPFDDLLALEQEAWAVASQVDATNDDEAGTP